MIMDVCKERSDFIFKVKLLRNKQPRNLNLR